MNWVASRCKDSPKDRERSTCAIRDVHQKHLVVEKKVEKAVIHTQIDKSIS